MLNGTKPQNAATTGGADPQADAGAGGPAANVVPFAPRRERLEVERAGRSYGPVARQAAALQALARRRAAFDRYALAGHELVADLRAGRDPALAVAAFKRKVGED